MTENERRRHLFEQEVNRRRFLAISGAAGLAGILAACGGSDSSGTTAATTAAGETPVASGSTAAADAVKTGGRLRIAHVGGGDAETFDPARGSNFIDASRYYNVYDPLTRVNPDFTTSPGLALEWTPNADSTEWQIALRPDVTWHDGSPFNANDVIYTMRSMAKEGHVSAASVANVDLDGLKATDDLTVVVPLKSSNARLFDSFLQQNTVIIKDGVTDFSKPVGTGPFMFQEFTPGKSSLCVKNPNYWEPGKPYVDEWEDISIDDPAARLKALQAGEVDMISQIGFVEAKSEQQKGEIQVIAATSPAVQVFIMAVDKPPFDNVKVRQAFRLACDRQALIDVALAGFGSPANDLAGAKLPFFLDAPVPTRDVDAAKALLAEAGATDLKLTLQTSDVVPGFIEAATLFAEQLKDIGVTVEIQKEDAGAYFDTERLYTKMDFAQSFWTLSSVGLWYEQALLSDAVWNETHFRDPAYDDLIRQAQGAPTEAEATELFKQVQQRQLDEGGYIVWANQSLVDGAANYVKGVVPSSFFNLGGWNYRDAWLDK